MIDRVKLQSMLLAAIATRVAPHGFERQPKIQEYCKPIDGGEAGFHLGFIKHPDDFDVIATVAIRFEDLETLVNEKKHYLSAKEKKRTYSLGAELGNIVDRRPRRWSIKSEADVEPAVDAIEDRFVNVAVPYVNQYSIRTEAMEIFAGDTMSSWIHSPVHGERAMRAVGLAWLLKDDARCRQLIEAKTAFLEQRKDFGLDEFRNFVNSLPK